MLLSEREYKAVLLYNLCGFIAYCELYALTFKLPYIICAIVFGVSTVLSYKAYSTFKWCEKVSR